MRVDSLQARLAGEGTAFGVWINDPEMVEVAAHVGFDWFLIDQMYTSNDWAKTSELIRAGEAFGVTPILRIQSHPWLGYDHRVAVEVSRAQGIGAKYIFVSYSGPEELRECLHVTRDWHRKPLTLISHSEDDHAEGPLWGDRTVLIPHPETAQTLASVEETLAEPEIRVLFIPMGDASRILSAPGKPDWYTPSLWTLIDKAVAQANAKGAFIGANSSMAPSLSEQLERVVRLSTRGVRVIMVQGATTFFQLAATDLLKEVRERTAERKRTSEES